MEGLREVNVNDELIIAIQLDLASAQVSEREKSLLYLAEAITMHPSDAAEAVHIARSAGWNDTELAHAIFLISYFNMATRIAVAFNLPPDEYHHFNPADSIPILPLEQGH